MTTYLIRKADAPGSGQGSTPLSRREARRVTSSKKYRERLKTRDLLALKIQLFDHDQGTLEFMKL